MGARARACSRHPAQRRAPARCAAPQSARWGGGPGAAGSARLVSWAAACQRNLRSCRARRAGLCVQGDVGQVGRWRRELACAQCSYSSASTGGLAEAVPREHMRLTRLQRRRTVPRRTEGSLGRASPRRRRPLADDDDDRQASPGCPGWPCTGCECCHCCGVHHRCCTSPRLAAGRPPPPAVAAAVQRAGACGC